MTNQHRTYLAEVDRGPIESLESCIEEVETSSEAGFQRVRGPSQEEGQFESDLGEAQPLIEPESERLDVRRLCQ